MNLKRMLFTLASILAFFPSLSSADCFEFEKPRPISTGESFREAYENCSVTELQQMKGNLRNLRLGKAGNADTRILQIYEKEKRWKEMLNEDGLLIGRPGSDQVALEILNEARIDTCISKIDFELLRRALIDSGISSPLLR